MEKICRLIPLVFTALVFILVYIRFFNTLPISAGDFVPLEKQNIEYWLKYSFYIWQSQSGLGGDVSFISAYAPIATILALFSFFTGFNVFIFEKIINFGLFFLFGLVVISLFYRKIFPGSKYWFLSPLIFLCNTYILMIIGGGQIVGIYQAYVFLPLVILLFLQAYKKVSSNRKFGIGTVFLPGIALSVLTALDVRIGYMSTIVAMILAIIISLISKPSLREKFSLLKMNLIAFLAILSIVVLTHLYWILPTILNQNPTSLPQNFASSEMIDFLSFTKLEHSISLLHPNWPENSFGKVRFFNPVFLVFPLIAFLTLLFVKRIKDEDVRIALVSLVLLSLIAAFMAKGSSDPFGLLYLHLSNSIPGFSMLRDSTKWFMVIAVCYSLLIPFSLSKFTELQITKNYKKPLQVIVPTAFILFFGFAMIPALQGQLSGAFKNFPKPDEYSEFSRMIAADASFSRTLWLPERQKFAPFSIVHPVISGRQLLELTGAENIPDIVASSNFQTILVYLSLKYIVLPDDSDRYIFNDKDLFDRKKYNDTLQALNNADFLVKQPVYKNLNVYVATIESERFKILGKGFVSSYKQVSPTEYIVSVKNAKSSDVLYFSELYSPGWRAYSLGSDKEMGSIMKGQMINSFAPGIVGNYSLRVVYGNQKFVWVGLLISSFSTVLLVVIYGYMRFKRTARS